MRVWRSRRLAEVDGGMLTIECIRCCAKADWNSKDTYLIVFTNSYHFILTEVACEQVVLAVFRSGQ